MRYPKDHKSQFDGKTYRKERREKRSVLGLCTRCDNKVSLGFKDCEICIIETKNRVQISRDRCKELKLCIHCKKPARIGNLRCLDCSVNANANGRSRQKTNKINVMSRYGKAGIQQCCWKDCDVTDIDMLTLDHVENNGAQHRKEYTKTGRGGGSKLYGRLIKANFPPGYQTLCANHNLKKHIMSLSS